MKNLLLLFGISVSALFAQDHVAIENTQVRVTKITVPAHAKRTPREYNLNRVIVYIDDGAAVVMGANRQAKKLAWKSGEIRWVPAGWYAEENTGDHPFREFDVEIKSPASGKPVIWPAMDPLKVDPKHYRLKFENGQVRVIDVKTGAHEITLLHQHDTGRVSVYLTDLHAKVTAANGSTSESKFSVGETSWGDPVTHTEVNLADKVFHVVLVEIKP